MDQRVGRKGCGGLPLRPGSNHPPRQSQAWPTARHLLLPRGELSSEAAADWVPRPPGSQSQGLTCTHPSSRASQAGTKVPGARACLKVSTPRMPLSSHGTVSFSSCLENTDQSLPWLLPFPVVGEAFPILSEHALCTHSVPSGS